MVNLSVFVVEEHHGGSQSKIAQKRNVLFQGSVGLSAAPARLSGHDESFKQLGFHGGSRCWKMG